MKRLSVSVPRPPEASAPNSAVNVSRGRVLRSRGRLLIAVHAGTGAQHFSDYKGAPVDVDLVYREPTTLAAQVRRAGFAVESIEVRPPYAFEHATERLYVAARAA